MKTTKPSAPSRNVRAALLGFKESKNTEKLPDNTSTRVDTKEPITPKRSMFSPYRLQQLKKPHSIAGSTLVSTLAAGAENAYAASFYDYVDRLAVSLPDPLKYDKEGYTKPSLGEAEIDRNHVALYLGESDCIGTGHVARWVADAIENGIQNGQFLQNLQIKNAHKTAIRENLAFSVDKLRELHLIRSHLDYTKMSLHYLSHFEKTSCNHIGTIFTSQVAAYILSRLFSGQQVLIPVDFWGYDYAENLAGDSGLIGHATSM